MFFHGTIQKIISNLQIFFPKKKIFLPIFSSKVIFKIRTNERTIVIFQLFENFRDRNRIRFVGHASIPSVVTTYSSIRARRIPGAHAIVKPLGWHPVRKVPPWAAAVSDLLAANVVTF